VTYPFRTAASGLWREKWINFLCTLTIASGLFLMSMAFLFVHNMGIATRELPDRFSVMVFLKEGLQVDAVKETVLAVRNREGVKTVRYISKEEALKELKIAMRDSDYVLEGLEENPLPASLELKLMSGEVTEYRVRKLASELKKLDGVDDVQYGAKMLSLIQRARTYSETIGAVLIAVLSTGVIFVCYSTVKILFYRKKPEIDTLKLLGATKWFIRSPFVIEGGALGLAAGVLSAIGMLSVYFLVYLRLARSFPMVKAVSLPPELLAAAPAAGLAIGVAGALIAIGRIRY
jgi:cell division transport system permease protein